MQRTLLIVDDAQADRKLLRKILGDEYEVLEAENGKEAMSIMHSCAIPLSAVLLDLEMPVMDGFEVLERMRRDEELKDLPVLAVTGPAEENSAVRALELGANDCMTKPYSAVLIKQRLKNTIGLRESAETVGTLQRDAYERIGAERGVTKYSTAFEQLKLLTESIPGGIASFELTPSGLRNIYFNEGFYDFSGYTREEYAAIIAADPWGLVFKEDLSPLLEGLRELRRGGESAPDYIYRCHTKDGGCRWMSMKVAVSEARSDTLLINAVRFDITERRQSDELLRISEEQCRLAMKQSGTIMCTYNAADGSESMNPDTAAVFDLPETVQDVPYSIVNMGRLAPGSTAAYIRFYEGILRGERSGTAEFEQKTALGWRWLKAHQSSVFSDDGKPIYAVISFVDNTERHRQEQQHAALLQNERILRQKASTDGLTGVYNKSVTEAKIIERLSHGGAESCALLIADIDDLKLINDTLGHPQGDRAICAIADVLEAHFRRSDIVGRIGGDEFIVFLEGVCSRDKISGMLEALLESIENIKIGGESGCAVSLSIGAATVEGDKTSFEELYSRADKALYRAKRNGKRQFALYSQELDRTGTQQ